MPMVRTMVWSNRFYFVHDNPQTAGRTLSNETVGRARQSCNFFTVCIGERRDRTRKNRPLRASQLAARASPVVRAPAHCVRAGADLGGDLLESRSRHTDTTEAADEAPTGFAYAPKRATSD